ncbi:hypothetical protein D3C72_969660 [compost metagenome]
MAVAAEDTAVIHRHRRLQRTVDGQAPLIDQGRAAVSVVAGQHQRADTLFGQTAVTGNIVAPGIETTGDVGTHALGRFALIDDRADARQIGNELAGAIRAVDTEFRWNVLLGDEHRRAVDAFAQVDHAPAVQGVDARCAEVGGRSAQDRGDLITAHVREAFHQHRHGTGDMRRGHRGAVVVFVAGGQVVGVGAFDDRAENLCARRRDAETRGVAATRRERTHDVRIGAGQIRVLLQRSDGDPVRRDVRDEIAEAGDGVRVVEVVVITGGEDRHDATARGGNRTVVGAAGLGAEQRADLVELHLRVIDGEVRVRRIAAAEVETVSDADAPAVVDDPRAAGDQCVPTGLVHRAVVATNDAVLRARVTVVGADDLRTECHAVHRPAVATAGGDTADVGAVGAEFAVGTDRGRTVIAERIAGFDRDVRVGVFANPAGDQGDDFIAAGELRVRGIHRLIKDPQFHAFAGIAGGISVIGTDRAQAPIGLKFGTAPTRRIARTTALHVGRGVGGTNGTEHGEREGFQGKAASRLRGGIVVIHPATFLSDVAKNPDRCH